MVVIQVEKLFIMIRVIVLHEGERRFDTYIRVANNEMESFVTFPNSFY